MNILDILKPFGVTIDSVQSDEALDAKAVCCLPQIVLGDPHVLLTHGIVLQLGDSLLTPVFNFLEHLEKWTRFMLQDFKPFQFSILSQLETSLALAATPDAFRDS